MGLCLLIVAIILHFTDGDLLRLLNAAIDSNSHVIDRMHDMEAFFFFFSILVDD